MPNISEEKTEKIRKEAQEILKSFGKSLESVKIEKKSKKSEPQGFREESTGLQSDDSFRKAVFKNAPNKSKDFILAEKKKW